MMDTVRGSRDLFVLLGVVMIAAAIAGCGSDQENMPVAKGGVTSASTPTAGMKTCAGCHTGQTNGWLTSKHANLDPAGNLWSAGSPTSGLLNTEACRSCHDPLGDSSSLTAGYTGNVTRPVVGCESCHGPGSLHVAAGGMGPVSLLSGTRTPATLGGVQVSGQFLMCTSCHELLNTSGGLKTAPAHLTGEPEPNGGQYVITDTHFATAGTYAADGHNLGASPVGYSMKFANERVCTECHNPHGTAEINREWAASGHADRNPLGPWGYYNWSCDGPNCGGPIGFGTRTTCQRCHTTTGFASHVNALRNGNTTLADGISTGTSPAIVYDSAFKPEMLTCTGCHTDNRGTIRNPGPYKATYKLPVADLPASSIIPTAAQVAYQYPDIGESNVCMPCHTGRGSGRTIHALNSGSTNAEDFGSLFDSLGFPLGYNLVDGHYLTAGGTMFRGTGYEFPGRNYADPSSFKHKLIGTSSASGTGNNGPCVGCHMERPGLAANHGFQPVSKNDSGEIVNVSSDLCFTCHAGSSTGLAQILEQEKKEYEAGLKALEHELLVSSPSFSFDPKAFPYLNYFNWLSNGDTDWTGNTTGKNNLGAGFNMSLLYHEPGGYVHNSRYVKRIIYDSVDWLDNNKMDYSVGVTLTAICAAEEPPSWCAGAKSYLLYGASGTSSERP